ncbi:hypothetical protein DRP04_06780 [Archaeoglobales archaeon]|nr:MAG: hypothetical protein DRP04_06780 [Archaeoglobales archaeon]
MGRPIFIGNIYFKLLDDYGDYYLVKVPKPLMGYIDALNMCGGGELVDMKHYMKIGRREGKILLRKELVRIEKNRAVVVCQPKEKVVYVDSACLCEMLDEFLYHLYMISTALPRKKMFRFFAWRRDIKMYIAEIFVKIVESPDFLFGWEVFKPVKDILMSKYKHVVDEALFYAEERIKYLSKKHGIPLGGSLHAQDTFLITGGVITYAITSDYELRIAFRVPGIIYLFKPPEFAEFLVKLWYRAKEYHVDRGLAVASPVDYLERREEFEYGYPKKLQEYTT